MGLFKIIKTGHVVEIYEFERMPCKRGGGRGQQSERWEMYRVWNGKRVRDRVRRLVTANFGPGDKFITLTFRDGSVYDLTDVQLCYKMLDRFLKRLKRRFPDVKAVIVPEFQDKHGRGAVHYHMICNLSYIPHKDLEALWGCGFVGINCIDHVDNIGAYVVKYMSKSSSDRRLKGLKSYYRVGKLKEPDVNWTDDPAEVKGEIGNASPVFQSQYGDDYHGRILYSQYNTMRKD